MKYLCSIVDKVTAAAPPVFCCIHKGRNLNEFQFEVTSEKKDFSPQLAT